MDKSGIRSSFNLYFRKVIAIDHFRKIEMKKDSENGSIALCRIDLLAKLA